jgi:hypothetical protein
MKMPNPPQGTSGAPTDEELAALIKPLWLKEKPSGDAQAIRGAISTAVDGSKYLQWALEYVPDYVWDLIDIAAQRGIARARVEHGISASSRQVCVNTLEKYSRKYSEMFGIYLISFEIQSNTADFWVTIDDDCKPETRVLDGWIKWDGCSNWTFGRPVPGSMVHFCGKAEAVGIGDLMRRLYEIAAEWMPAYDRECAEG